jgi:excisionase family DNA binding protein
VPVWQILRKYMEPIAVSISDATKIIGCGRTKLYELVAEGKLPARKLGTRTLVLYKDLLELVRSAPEPSLTKGVRDV